MAFAEVATKPEVLNSLGATVIYEDMLSQYVEVLSRGETASEDECFLCRFAREFEEIYISNFATCVIVMRNFFTQVLRVECSVLC